MDRLAKLTAPADAPQRERRRQPLFAGFRSRSEHIFGTAPDATPPWRAQCAAVPLPRIAWLVTVLVALLTGVILLLDGYTGYGILAFVVGASAAVNLA